MDMQWREVSTGQQVVELLGLGSIGVPALERLLLAPESGAYLRAEIDEESSTPGAFDIRVPGTRFYFNVTACKRVRGDLGVALAAYLATHNLPAAASAAALRTLWESVNLLSDEEVAVVRAIVSVCSGNPYEVPVAEDAVRARYRGDASVFDDLLDVLQAKNVIEGRRLGRIKLVY